MRKSLMHIAFGAAIALMPSLAQADDGLNLTISGGSPSGLWSMLGAGIDNAVRESVPGSIVTYQTSGGGLANVAIVSRGQAELGIIHNIELKVAAEGTDPFKEPISNLRALAVLYNWAPMQIVATKSFVEQYDIHSVADIVEKKVPVRIAVNQLGNMVEATNRKIFEAYGATWEDIESWGGQIIYAPGGDMTNLFSDRRIDIGSNGVFVPDSRFVEISRSMDVVMLPLSEDAIAEVAAATGAEPYVIPAGGYEWQPEPVPTVALSAVLVASAEMPDEEAYQITKALVEQINKVREVHKAMASLQPELMPSLKVIPYHAGAERYYREAGLLDD